MPPTLPFMSSLGQSAASGAASAGGSSFGSFLGNLLFGPFMAAQQWGYQKKQMALQQKYALAQMAKSAQYQLDHDKQMFDYENAYNEPSKVFDRYLKAGVTPAGVLGSTGVGVSATIPTASGGAPSASGPSGGPAIGSPMGFAGDPRAIAANMLSDSERQRNISAANRDDAEADKLRGDTHSKQWRLDMDEFAKSIAEANVSSAEATSRLISAQARLMNVSAELSEATYGYQFEKVIAEVGVLKEEYDQLRKYNVHYMDQMLTSSICLNWARMFEALQQGELASSQSELVDVTIADAREWFKVNWETPVDVQLYDDKGHPTQVVKMTGREMQAVLLGLSVESSDLEKGSARWMLRSAKNRLGYSVLQTLTSAGGLLGAAAVAKGGKGKTLPTTEVSYSSENYDGKGELRGYTRSTSTTTHK